MLDYRCAEMPRLVDEYQQVVKNANQYILDLERDDRLIQKLSHVRDWYYIKVYNRYIFAPSKFIGYENNNADYYEEHRKNNMNGGHAKDRLNRWFKELDKESNLYEQLEGDLKEFVNSYDKKINKLFTIHVLDMDEVY